MPASPWEFDEPLFFHALHDYDPAAHHPPPPGYPVFILFAQLVRAVVPSDFAALLAINVTASAIAFVLLARAFRNFSGDENAGVIGALLFYLSPAMLMHSTLPISEPGALALLAASLYFAGAGEGRREAMLFALFAALSVGWRIQFSIFVVPYFLATVMLLRRHRLAALAVFTVTCLAWLAPLAIALGGIEELVAFELGQGRYVASHDAAESRTGWTPVRIAFRFIGRAWGHEWVAPLVLACAAFGALRTLRRREVWPLAVGAAVYIAVALRVMDPADGVRYAIPFVLAAAFFAGAGMARLRAPYAVVAIAVAAFLVYTGPHLWQRRTTVSPPVRAAQWARATQPAHAIALYDLPLWPHATYFLRGFAPMRVDEGLARYYDRPDVPLFIYADGASATPGTRVFAWKRTDAYEKLTRNHYRVVSIVPVPPERRFRVVEGVFGPERDPAGREWRWLSSPAALQLPPGRERVVTLDLGLPVSAPYRANEVVVRTDGGEPVRVRVGQRTRVAVRVPAGAPLLRIESARTFIPAEVPALRSGDRRRLAVELYSLHAVPAP